MTHHLNLEGKSTKETILAWLRSKGYGWRNSRALSAVASGSDCSETTARKYLRELETEGLVTHTSWSRGLARRYYAVEPPS
jgi:predicted ArsR family transcriptional regulator